MNSTNGLLLHKNSMMKSARWRLAVVGLLLITLILACGTPASTPPASQDDLLEAAVQQTFVAQTVIAAQANNAAPQNPPAQDQPPQDEPPAATVTPSVTPPPTNTFTPGVPMVSVSVDTNCRVGPGQPYELVGALLVGEQTEVVARDPSGLYWYVRNPDQAGFCWLWGNYAATTGNTGSLPVFTPPPTPTFTPSPTPVFDYIAEYHDTHICVPGSTTAFITFYVGDTGQTALESADIHVIDTFDNSDLFTGWTDVPFAGTATECDSNLHNIGPGAVAYIPLPTDSWNLSLRVGNEALATIKICSLDGLAGTCKTTEITFEIPPP